MTTENNDIPILTFNAHRKFLDWQGNVIEKVEKYQYEWKNYDPQVFLESVIRNGNLSSVPPLSSTYAYEFMCSLNKNFGHAYNSYDDMAKYERIESESFNGIKFVVYDRIDGSVMKWQD